jgi:hypothetical protein
MPREAYGKQPCVCGHGKSIHEPESGRLKPVKRSPCNHLHANVATISQRDTRNECHAQGFAANSTAMSRLIISLEGTAIRLSVSLSRTVDCERDRAL